MKERQIGSEGGWIAFRVKGELDFGLVGILASIVNPLKIAGVSVFAISTFNTDYILVKQESLDKAIKAWNHSDIKLLI